ncbi:MAG TPA: hypothetical protein VG126_02065 [Thermoleophilaceae bacterium]|nr:hypothetical protein [Thermoleophilaceae bacterium]
MRARRLAWSAFGLTFVIAVVATVFGFVDDGTLLAPPDTGEVTWSGSLSFAIMIVAFAALGALVASRRPGNPIGWILCVSPLCLAFTELARNWYVHTLIAEPGSLPLASGLMWAANWAWIPGFMPLLTLLLLLFPDGHVPSLRWRSVGWLAVAAMGLLIVGYALAPGPLEDYPRVDNPVGISGAAGDVLEIFQGVGFPFFALAATGSMASLVVRFRRSHGVERQQLKWMAAAAALVVAAWLVNAFFDQVLGEDISLILPLALLALPAAATTAILRYRLYDLGLVVNRTLVYGALTATLAGAYIGSVLLLQLALDPLTSDSGLAIAGSTLAVAALFRPARRRIQELVDRRFYRRRYDAARTVEGFSARLRDEVELDALSGELRAVVSETVQPAHVSLWLRPEAGR